MDAFRIFGGLPIVGEYELRGAKNAVLPLLAAALLCEGELELLNCPRLNDISNMLAILSSLGCRVTMNGRTIHISSATAVSHIMPEELSKRMRSSIFMLGPVLSRFGKAKFTYPGGCEIGLRPIDLHLSALRAMGAHIQEDRGEIQCEGVLHGAQIHLDYPSVGATETILMAAARAKGETVIQNAAREPEVKDLAELLNRCGAKIQGAGNGTITIQGQPKLSGCVYTPTSDRIVAGTLLLAGAMTGGDVFVRNARAEDMQALLNKMRQMGCAILDDSAGVRAVMRRGTRLKAVRRVETNPYPSFPTDMQAQMVAALSIAQGTALVVENVFENRFAHAAELMRMGADIELDGRIAVVRGVAKLHGSVVTSRDLRGGAALVLAALTAKGESVVENVHYIDRGYESMEEMLHGMGAAVERIETEG